MKQINSKLVLAIIGGIVMSAIALKSPFAFWLICMGIATAILLGLI